MVPVVIVSLRLMTDVYSQDEMASLDVTSRMVGDLSKVPPAFPRREIAFFKRNFRLMSQPTDATRNLSCS
jgi:hypothetical protein